MSATYCERCGVPHLGECFDEWAARQSGAVVRDEDGKMKAPGKRLHLWRLRYYLDGQQVDVVFFEEYREAVGAREGWLAEWGCLGRSSAVLELVPAAK
jgi:hypothetical protein